MAVLRTNLLLAVAAIAAPLIGSVAPAEAGCACDHPPPIRGLVYPRFAQPGQTVNVYTTAIRKNRPGCVQTGALSFDTVEGDGDPYSENAQVSNLAPTGPAETRIWAKGCSETALGTAKETIQSSHLTVLSQRLPIVEASGTFYYTTLAAVDAEGTILVPFDLSEVRDPTQFFVTMWGLPLRFDESGVVYFNADEFNLKLFESAVLDPDDYQWGRYYGVLVEPSGDPLLHSDVLSYWRHEFHTYEEAHRPGGTHEEQPNGLHPDGTVHVDHDLLVAAISGTINGRKPKPGVIPLVIQVQQIISKDPLRYDEVQAQPPAVLSDNVFYVVVDQTGLPTVQAIDGITDVLDELDMASMTRVHKAVEKVETKLTATVGGLLSKRRP